MEQETQYFDCYTFKPFDDPHVDVCIDLSLVLHNIDKPLLVRIAASCISIALVIEKVLEIPSTALAIIVKHISPKLKTFVMTDCDNLTWGDVKPILAAAGAVEHIDIRRNKWVDDYVMVIVCINQLTYLNTLHVTETFLFFTGTISNKVL